MALFEVAYPAQYDFMKAWFDERLDQAQQEALMTALEALRADPTHDTPPCGEDGETP